MENDDSIVKKTTVDRDKQKVLKELYETPTEDRHLGVQDNLEKFGSKVVWVNVRENVHNLC